MATTLAPPPARAAAVAEPPKQDRRLGRWAALAALLGVTAVLYLWDLTASGYANTFYAAAAQAGSKDWTAWFFGSLDPENFITVDKPPASLWVMGLSARIFGFSSAAILVPQALMGVASVATVYAAVRRVTANGWAAWLGGAVVAATPAAALMFRFDNPDALLVLLMALGAYFVVRAVEHPVGRRAAMWLALAGAALGFAFLTKMLQGLLVLPAFALAYLVAGRPRLRARLLHLVGAGAALVVSAGWWIVAATLWPAESRPYIGGSTDNTVMDLVLGYNGFGRIFGHGGGGGGGGGGGAAGSSFGGATGLDRLFGSEMGIEISWLIPAALVLLVFGLILRGRAPRTDGLRASLLLWGGWFVITALVFSYMSGTVHPYYTVALTPAIAGMIGVGGYAVWLRREQWGARVILAGAVLAAAITGFVLLNRNADWHPWLRWSILVAAVVAAVAIVAAGSYRWRKIAAAGLIVGSIAGLAGPASYAIATAATPHGGSIPTAGPSGATQGGGMGGMRPDGGGSQPGGGAGGPDGGASDNAELITLLRDAGTGWSAAVSGSQSAATLELSSDTAVMAIGGWSGDPTPTLAQFQQYVANSEVHYLIGSGNGGGPGGQGGSFSEIQEWVTAHYTATTVGGTTVYNLTDPIE